MKRPSIICVIPARLKSERFPRKILAHIDGKPLIQHTWQAAMSVSLFDEVIIALDDNETIDVVKTFTHNYHLTDPSIPSGTHRLIATMNDLDKKADIWVNWQADEPFISEHNILELLGHNPQVTGAHIWTLKTPIKNAHEITSPNIVKVVFNEKEQAMYFSRSPIPFARNGNFYAHQYYRHIGLYAYTYEALQLINTTPESPLAQIECLEQLTFLARGIPITIHSTEQMTIGIDTEEDLALAKKHYLRTIA